MKVQSVSQLGLKSLSDISSAVSAVVEVSIQTSEDNTDYESCKFDFKDFIAWISSFVSYTDSKIDELSNTINHQYVHLSGNEQISGTKTFTGTLSATSVAQLSAKHALWS